VARINSANKQLVLIGGGHSHAIALRLFGMYPIPGVHLTLISEAADTPYSGMLPGHVAGYYEREECFINLQSLAKLAGAQFHIARVEGLDLERQQVLCADLAPIPFDLLSINIGSIPTVPQTIPWELRDRGIPAKPIRYFLERWDDLVALMQANPPSSMRVAIVGGGVGGVELLLAMQYRLNKMLDPRRTQLEFHLLHRDTQLLPGHNRWVQQHLQQILSQRGVLLHLNEQVIDMAGDISGGEPCVLRCQSGFSLPCDRAIWVTQAAAPEWLRVAGLAVDARGFVLVRDTLQSASHPQVFAAGDIATMMHHPRPKAGVFAVRQGKPLFRNLRNTLLGESLEAYIPQKHYLNLIGTADGSAIASRGYLAWESHLLWCWKDRIDRAFMRQFN
jgi:selenide,water dikinase